MSAQSPVLNVSCPEGRSASASARRVQGVQFHPAFNARPSIRHELPGEFYVNRRHGDQAPDQGDSRIFPQLCGRWLGDTLKVRVTAPAERGKANAAIETILAEALGISRASARVVAGKTSPRKIVEITGLSETEVYRRLSKGID